MKLFIALKLAYVALQATIPGAGSYSLQSSADGLLWSVEASGRVTGTNVCHVEHHVPLEQGHRIFRLEFRAE